MLALHCVSVWVLSEPLISLWHNQDTLGTFKAIHWYREKLSILQISISNTVLCFLMIQIDLLQPCLCLD